MAIKKAPAFILHIFIIAASGAGLIVLSGISGGASAVRWANLFVYYTNLSNLACFLMFLYIAVNDASGFIKMRIAGKANGAGDFPAPYYLTKGAVLMMTTVTMFVYHLMLSSTGFIMRVNADSNLKTANTLLHYVAPCLSLLDWILFTEKNKLKRHYPLIWLTLPFAYFIFTLIRARLGGPEPLPGTASRFPYYFLDVDALGISGVFMYVLILTAAFAALGYIIFFIDKLLGKLFYYINKKA